MPKYSSRIGSTNISSKPKQSVSAKQVKMSTVKATVEPKSTTLTPENVVSGGAIKTAGSISSAGSLPTAGSISTGGVLPTPKRTGTTRPATDFSPPFSIQVTPESAMRLGYMPYIHALGAMSPQDFHLLQGVAAAYMPAVQHPMKDVAKAALGGAFKLPRIISKVAHKDILKATTPQQLSNALYMEMLDQGKSKKGGALLDSLRNVFGKAVSGVRRGATAAVKGAKAGIQIGAKGLGIGLNLAERLEQALGTGIDIAQAVSPVAQQIFGEEIKKPVQAGIALATAAQERLQSGIKVGQLVQSVVDPLAETISQRDIAAQLGENPLADEPVFN